MYPVVLGVGSQVPRQQKADMLNSAVLRSRAPGAQMAKSLAFCRLHNGHSQSFTGKTLSIGNPITVLLQSDFTHFFIGGAVTSYHTPSRSSLLVLIPGGSRGDDTFTWVLSLSLLLSLGAVYNPAPAVCGQRRCDRLNVY